MAAPWRLLGPLLLALLLVGCGPQYRTFTSYQPPASQAGMQCVSSCLDLKTVCRGERGDDIAQCRLEARQEADARTAELERTYAIDLGRYAAGGLEEMPATPRAVSPNYGSCARIEAQLESRCASDFDICYQTCGGRITHATHCVANCDP